MFRRYAKFGALAVALSLPLAGCDDDGAAGPDDGTLSILLTDKPADLAQAWVEITEIYLQGQGPDGDRVVLRDESAGLIDLLTLSGGRTAELVEDAVVPAGTYSQLRFIIGDAYIVTADGDVYATEDADVPDELEVVGTLKCPSCAQTGFKVNLPDGSVAIDDETRIVVVDFDVSQTFGHQAGRSGKWIMHPVLHATGFGTASTIDGTVALADEAELEGTCGGQDVVLTLFAPTATARTLKDGDGNPVVRTATVETDGGFTFGFVAPDEYDLGDDDVVFENGDTLVFAATADPSTVKLASGETVTVGYTVTGTECRVAQD